MEDAELRVGPLTREALQTDNQVVRALEMLRSYAIFNHMKS
jgi:hypothetical protein